MFDLVITGGTVLDPEAGLGGRLDVGIREGRIAKLADSLQADDSRASFDATGKYVVPGLIDLHTHAFAGYHGAAPDLVSLQRGTTTVVDAGSSGANAIGAFENWIANSSRTRVKAWLNISTIGLIDVRVGELYQLLHVDRDAAIDAVNRHRELIVGIKIRISEYVAGSDFRPSLSIAHEVAEVTDLPIMVHVGSTNLPLEVALDSLRPGDVVTHMFTGMPKGIFDSEGRVTRGVREARERGVLFDGAHGRRHFSFESARQSIEQDFPPDTMSSDISHRAVEDTSYHLPLVLSKLIAVGYELIDLIPMVTSRPARLVLRDDEIGTLKPGSCADVCILESVDGPTTFTDSMGRKMNGTTRLHPVLTVRAGELVQAVGA